ncbi:hypothetical protein SLE2022_074240 [Rubroshorea leprosula]
MDRKPGNMKKNECLYFRRRNKTEKCYWPRIKREKIEELPFAWHSPTQAVLGVMGSCLHKMLNLRLSRTSPKDTSNSNCFFMKQRNAHFSVALKDDKLRDP